ncbi:MAG: sugar ABC transporter permease [Anaerolineales bacterium]|nr:sugar ABC transporter permease [Anaerolineales bacterium]
MHRPTTGTRYYIPDDGKLKMKNKIYPFYFSAGAVLLYSLFMVLPGLLGFFLSFTDWNRYSSEINFIGFQNFALIFSKKNYWNSIINTVIFTVVTIGLKTLFALILALLLTKGLKRFFNFHRAIIYLPSIIPMIVVGIVFKSILHPSSGVLNEFLRGMGLDFMAQKWLTNPDLALYSVALVDTWKGVGFIMVILIAGILVIPVEYYEAAQIDGANQWDELWNITLPLLMPTLTVTTVLNLLYGLKVFDVVWVLTNGGPGYATETVYTLVFKEFSKGRYGVSTALSTLLFVIMSICGYWLIKMMHSNELEA